jgi:peptidoglycan/LPS O-acetylase OafA/YrhL
MTKLSTDIYFKQLNGIRFIAVFLVLLDHWLVPILPIPLGHLGVVIFFVLSGFLITRILFLSADEIHETKSSAWPKIIRFIYRRSLRIFPIYFILLFIGLIFNISNFNELWPWLVSYTPNIYMMIKGQWMGTWDHLWSLAVEEQYYLIFPYFILFFNKKNYLRLFIIMIIIGIMSRLYFYFFQTHIMKENMYMINEVNTISVLDPFGIGGFLAYLYHYNLNLCKKLLLNSYMTLITLFIYILSLCLSYSSDYSYDNIYYIVLRTILASVFSFYLIGNSIFSTGSTMNLILENKVIAYLGSISYGIYLYHNLVYNYYHLNGNTIWSYLIKKFPLFDSINSDLLIIKFSINFLFIVGIASFSWFYIEKPINRYKNRL